MKQSWMIWLSVMKNKVEKSEFVMLKKIMMWALCIICLSVAGNVYAAERRTVRVAFFPMDGYHIVNEDGSLGGMDVEYMNVISNYTAWNIEYIECESWSDALEKLSNKEVDLVGSAQYSAERAEIYNYADLSSGYTFGVIAANLDTDTAYEDFYAMKDFCFGMVKDYVRRAEFLEYLYHNGIEQPRIIEYETTADMHAALDACEIDAFVHTFTEVKEGQRLLGRFAPRPFYYITYQGNDELLRELNTAIVDVKMNWPELETELMNRFFYDKFDKAILLTTEEKQFLEEKKTISIGYLDNNYPFSYVEEDEFKGLTREILENGLSITGLETEYVLFENRQEARIALENGTIDILAYSTEQEDVLREHNLKSICDYAQVPLVLVKDKREKNDNIQTLATVSFLKEKADRVSAAEGVQIISFENQQDCIDALHNREVDAVLCNGYFVENLMRTDLQYDDLQIESILNIDYSISMAISNQQTQLSGILEKTISTIDSKMINEYMLKEITYPLVSIVDFIKDNSVVIIGILMVIMLIIIFVVLQKLADNKKIQKLMYKDTNMDIWNLNYFTYWGEHKLLPEKKNKYAIVYLNFLNFRRYNIIYGWSVGEQLLNVFVRELRSLVNEDKEICARSQGDRFVLLLNYSEETVFYDRLKEMKNTMEQRLNQINRDNLNLQLGVYLIPDKEIDIRRGINCANQALEFADSNVGSNIKIYDESLQELLKIKHDREKLLESVDINKDFVAFYQPKVDVRNGKIVGAEALVRFKDPSDGGKIKAPYFFVPYYEQTGRITEIDMFVCETVCKLLRKRMDAGLPVVTVSCNFSRMHFVKPGFADKFEAILEKYNVSKELIEVEVTETLLMEEMDQQRVKESFDELKNRKIHLSIDDFGAGYSSLGIFEQIPASVVKMDRSFFLNKDNPERQVKIMRGIVTLSEELDAQIVCEGVETQKDVNLMKEIGAFVAQGYFYSKPIPEEDFETLLNEGYI